MCKDQQICLNITTVIMYCGMFGANIEDECLIQKVSNDDGNDSLSFSNRTFRKFW